MTVVSMPDPAPLFVPWRGRSVRVRHDDPRLTPHSPRATVIIAAAQLAATPDGLRRVLHATVGEWYAVAVREEPLTVGLRRLTPGHACDIGLAHERRGADAQHAPAGSLQGIGTRS